VASDSIVAHPDAVRVSEYAGIEGNEGTDLAMELIMLNVSNIMASVKVGSSSPT
jgi:hypothetical protein